MASSSLSEIDFKIVEARSSGELFEDVDSLGRVPFGSMSRQSAAHIRSDHRIMSFE